MSRSGMVVLCCVVWLFAAQAAVADDPSSVFPPDDALALPQLRLDAAPLSIRVYHVADLVVDPEPPDAGTHRTAVENAPLPAAAPPPSSRQRTLESLSALSMLLQSVVAPESWELSGGPGRIAVHESAHLLVVRQSDAVHGEIQGLMRQLRSATELEVEVSCRVILPRSDDSASESTLRQLADDVQGPLDIAAANAWIDACRAECNVGATQRVRLLNGRTAQLGDTAVTAVVAVDLKSVRVHLSSPAQNGESIEHRCFCRIDDGSSILLPINWTGDSKCMLLSARIIPPAAAAEPMAPPTGSGELLPVTPADTAAVQPSAPAPRTELSP